jgi:hypothetical protein
MKKYLLTILSLILFLIYGCASVVPERISRPWIRTLKSNEIIDLTKKVKIDVSGITSPLLGNEQLISDCLDSTLTELIKRRGFTIENQAYDYLVKLTYHTNRNDKMSFSSKVSSRNYQTNIIFPGKGRTAGLGVAIASAIGILANSSSIGSSQTTEPVLSYTHTLSIEFTNKLGVLLWKGESTWDSIELNIIPQIIPALQVILSDLPSNKTIRPEVPEVKETHVTNYYRLECKDNWFTCPALPYRILFQSISSYDTDVSIPSSVKNLNAIAAYVDLIKTAEYALPDGDEEDWTDPIKESLWQNVTIGGQYFLGPDKKPINVLIELKGHTDGYYCHECKIVSDKKYSNFESKLSKWQEVLYNYYDFYQH